MVATFEAHRNTLIREPVKKVPCLLTVDGVEHELPRNKVIMRGETPLCIVRNSYEVVQMDDLLEQAEYAFEENMTESQLDSVQIVDRLDKDDTWLCREYVFPEIGNQIFSLSGEQRVGYRCILTNSYNARSSASLLTGLIDFYCTNGMVTGEFEQHRTRHTAGFDVRGFFRQIEESVKDVQNHIFTLQKLAEAKVLDEEKILQFYTKATNRGLGERLFTHFKEKEVPQRGMTLWGVMSALTFYSSHDSELFPIRADNTPYRLKRREDEVRKILNGRVWKDFRENIAA